MVAGVAVAIVATSCGGGDGSSRQDVVATRGAAVMPFDQARTMHHFVPNEAGGVEKVMANDSGDTSQISLVREHLKMEAERFARGDFSDPAAIHGEDMPGLGALKAGASRMTILYKDVKDGGQIDYSSTDSDLIAAIHDWFKAQASDHGSHAMTE
jgi:hypothetical protein